MKNPEKFKQHCDLIWSIANLLRGPYRPPQYRRMMIPLTVLHRLDSVQEVSTKSSSRAGIKHKLTKFRHPWTNGQVEIFNRKIKDHTTKRHYYDTVESQKNHLMAFLLAYNFQRPLKALNFKSPYDIIIETYQKQT